MISFYPISTASFSAGVSEWRSLTGTAEIALSATGEVMVEVRSLTASAPVELGVAGTVSSPNGIVASSILTLAASGLITSPNTIQADARIKLTAEGSLRSPNSLAGEAELGIGASGSISSPNALQAEVGIRLTASGSLTNPNKITGAAELSLTVSSTMLSPHALSGAAEITLGVDGTIAANLLLSGSAELELLAGGTVTIPVVLTGAAQIGLSAEGTILAAQQFVEEVVAGVISAYVVNTNTAGHSVYDNYNFNSFFRLGSTYYGCSSDGLFSIGATLDVPWEVKTGLTTFNEVRRKFVHDTRLTMRTNAEVEVTEIVDEQIERSNAIVTDDDLNGFHARRCKLPKGIHGTSWQFKISGARGAVDIKQFEVDQLVSVRTK